MVDIEKILENELKDKEKQQKSNNKVEKEIEKFVVNKKIKIIKQLLKEKITLILVSFSLLILILATSFYLIYFDSLKYLIDNKTQKFGNKNKIISEEKNLVLNNSIKENNEKETMEEFNKQKENSSQVESNYKKEIKELKEIVNKECANKSVNCLSNLAYKYKEPTFCLFAKEKSLCLEKYRNLFIEKKYEKAEELVEKLLKGEISKEDLKKENTSIEDLFSITGDKRLCNFLENPKQFSICNS